MTWELYVQIYCIVPLHIKNIQGQIIKTGLIPDLRLILNRIHQLNHKLRLISEQRLFNLAWFKYMFALAVFFPAFVSTLLRFLACYRHMVISRIV